MSVRHCPNCGTPFVRPVAQVGGMDRVLQWFHVSPFRCQLCMHRFRAATPRSEPAKPDDRRQFARLSTSIQAQLLNIEQVPGVRRLSDLSMGGCALAGLNVPKGAYLELLLRPSSESESIHVETAVVRSVRPDGVGVEFLELTSEARHRLSQVVLGLLVGQQPQLGLPQ